MTLPKTMKQNFRKLRVIALCLALATFALLFAGCAQKQTDTVAPATVSTVATVEGKNSGTELASIVNMMVGAYTKNPDPATNVRTKLIAATRGYDMTAEGFDDSSVTVGEEKLLNEDPALNEAAKLEIAKAVLKQANNQVESGKVSEEKIDGLNYADIDTIVNSLQVSVSDNASDFWGSIIGGIGKVLNWITNTLGFHYYIIGICIFAILVEILMIPFAIKQQKNSIKQAKLRPKEMAIRKKYAGRNDQATMQKMQQEIQAFYQSENYSPYSGCLPLVVQLPIILVLYQVVIKPMQYMLGLASNSVNALAVFCKTAKAAGGLGLKLGTGEIEWLSAIKANAGDLNLLEKFRVFSNGGEVLTRYNNVSGSVPKFNVGPIDMGQTPSVKGFFTSDFWSGGAWVLLLIPVLTFAAYFFTSKINRKFMPAPITGDGDKRQVACSNTMTDITMPAMSTVFTFMVPAVVGFYWIFRSLLSLLKSFIMSKIMPLPTFTKEDYEKAEKEMKGKKIIVKSENAGRVRSLHHIDDEDYEDTREAALARKAAMEKEDAAKEESKEDASSLENAPLKDESDKAPKKESRLKSLFSQKGDKSDKNKKQ